MESTDFASASPAFALIGSVTRRYAAFLVVASTSTGTSFETDGPTTNNNSRSVSSASQSEYRTESTEGSAYESTGSAASRSGYGSATRDSTIASVTGRMEAGTVPVRWVTMMLD